MTADDLVAVVVKALRDAKAGEGLFEYYGTSDDDGDLGADVDAIARVAVDALLGVVPHAARLDLSKLGHHELRSLRSAVAREIEVRELIHSLGTPGAQHADAVRKLAERWEGAPAAEAVARYQAGERR